MKFSNYNIIIHKNDSIFLMNTFTGSVYKIDENYRNIIENNLIDEIDIDTKTEYCEPLPLKITL